MRRHIKIIALLCVLGVAFFVLQRIGVGTVNQQDAAVALAVSSPFTYRFSVNGVLKEAGSMGDSTSPYWWLNSGGGLIISSGMGLTMQDDASSTNKWYKAYAISNPVDTDGGSHPQNVFRLVTRSTWDSASQEAQFFIVQDNFSSSPNRNASNGLLLMSRYIGDGQTLYYAGIRVDGTAVIKKKYRGVYYTMAQKRVFVGTYTGTQDNKNLLPHQQWITIRADTKSNADGSVTITLYMQLPEEATRTQLLQAQDSGQYGNTPPILGPAYTGIRTDFMDVKFRVFKMQNL